MTEKRLESRNNPRVRFYRSLDKREARNAAGVMPAEGVRLILEALGSPLETSELFLADSLEEAAAREILRLLEERGGAKATTVYRLPDALFNWMAHTQTPQGAAAVVSQPPKPTFHSLREWSMTVVLHRPQDPGNVGAILRSAEAAGFDGLIMVEPACDPYGPKAVRASMGSVFRMPVLWQISLEEVAGRLAGLGFEILAADPRGPTSIFDLELKRPLAVLFGGETTGLPPLEAFPVTMFSLPMMGQVESLNLAQAATVVLYEVMRRELKNY